jgi:hypothetical protein
MKFGRFGKSSYTRTDLSLVEKKFETILMRKQEKLELGRKIDSMVRRAEGDGPRGGSCIAGLSVLFARILGRGGSSGGSGVGAAELSTGSSEAATFNRAVFGMAGLKRGDPATKLEEAATIMRSRIESLEARALEQRTEAQRLVRSGGQKNQALRALKKSKATEKQIETNQASLMAVEQQVDLLAQATMQKTLSSALASTSKTMKRDAKALSKAEDAIDDAAEARDVANDLNGVIAEFALNGGGGHEDDDELLAELEAMSAPTNEPPPENIDAEAAREAEIAELEARLEAHRVARVQSEANQAIVASMPSAPSKPRRKEEKQSLLA